jgi:hypothetical protein
MSIPLTAICCVWSKAQGDGVVLDNRSHSLGRNGQKLLSLGFHGPRSDAYVRVMRHAKAKVIVYKRIDF